MNLAYVVALSVAVQLAAAILALTLIPLTEKRLAWSLIALALFLMAARRAISLYILIAGSTAAVMDPLQEYVGLVLSVSMLLGVALIRPIFTESKRVNEALRSSEEKFRTVADYAHDWEEWLAPDGAYRYVSPSCERITGHTAAEFMADPGLVVQITHPDDQAKVAEHYRGSTHSSQDQHPDQELEFRILTPNGETRWISHVCAAVFREDGHWSGRRASNRDITASKQNQAKLEASQLRWTTLFEAAPDAVHVNRLSDGLYLEVNEGFTALTGYTSDDVNGRTSADLGVWDDLGARARLVAALERDGEIRGLEADFRRKDGSLVPTLISARVVELGGETCAVSVTQDISGLKSAEKRIRRLGSVYAVLSRVNQALVHLHEPQAVFDEACRVIVEDGGFRMAWVGLVAPDGIHVEPVARAGAGADYADGIDLVLGDERRGRGPTGRTISERCRVVCQDIEHDPTMEPWREDALSRGYRSSAAFPLIVDNVAVGALCLYAGEPGFFDDEQIALLDELAGDISFTLELDERESVRKRAEEALVESERWLAESQRIAHLGHYIYDIDQDWWVGSPSLYDVLGVGEDYKRDLAGWLETVHPADRERMSVYFTEEVLEKRLPFDMEYRVLRPCDGVERWAHGLGMVDFADDGHPIRMFGIIQDVTERKRAEQRHQDILQSAMDGFWVSDAEGHLLEVNEAYCDMSGYSEQELLAMHISDLDASESAEDVAARVVAIRAHGQDRFESRHRRKDGSVFETETSVRYQPESGTFAVFLRDVTRRKEREEYGRLSRDILVLLSEPGAPNEFIPRIVSAIKTRTGLDAVGIRLHVGEDFPYFAEEGFPEGHLLTENTLIARDEDGEVLRDEDGNAVLVCACGLVLCGRSDPQLTPGGSFWTADSFPLLDLAPDGGPRLHPRNLCILEGFASVAAVPIRDREHVVGLIHLNDRRKDRFTLESVQLLEDIAAHIGEAMTRKRAEERLAKSLASVTDVVILVAEQRDPYTAGHMRRVSELAVPIAEELGMSAAQVEDIRLAALIHDVGKMSVPAEILSKPGRLSPVEFELIKNHSQAGYEIISSASMEGPTAEIVYQHHERCDGSGYPRGLTAGELLPESKVLMVADVVEAMVSHRPYRPGLGVDAALAEVEQGAGRLYEPAVAAACIRLFREKGFEFTAT